MFIRFLPLSIGLFALHFTGIIYDVMSIDYSSSICYMASGIKFIHFFQISEIIVPDILRNYFGYPKTGTYFRYIKKLFWTSKTTISDIRK